MTTKSFPFCTDEETEFSQSNFSAPLNQRPALRSPNEQDKHSARWIRTFYTWVYFETWKFSKFCYFVILEILIPVPALIERICGYSFSSEHSSSAHAMHRSAFYQNSNFVTFIFSDFHFFFLESEISKWSQPDKCSTLNFKNLAICQAILSVDDLLRNRSQQLPIWQISPNDKL